MYYLVQNFTPFDPKIEILQILSNFFFKEFDYFAQNLQI